MVEKPSIFYFEFELKINNLYLPNIVFTSDEGCLDQIYSEEDNNKHQVKTTLAPFQSLEVEQWSNNWDVVVAKKMIAFSNSIQKLDIGVGVGLVKIFQS